MSWEKALAVPAVVQNRPQRPQAPHHSLDECKLVLLDCDWCAAIITFRDVTAVNVDRCNVISDVIRCTLYTYKAASMVRPFVPPMPRQLMELFLPRPPLTYAPPLDRYGSFHI